MKPNRSLLKLITALFVASTALVGTLSFARGGGFDGGGGNLCYGSDGRPTLLEFADLAANLWEPGVQFEATPMTGLYGFGEFTRMYDGRIKTRVDSILNANEKLSPIIVSWLRLAVQENQFSFASARIEVPVRADTHSQSLCRDANVRASVLYFPPLMAFAELAQINQLDLDSQAGLVIHEAGRFVQMWLDKVDPSKTQFASLASDAGLQDLVRTLYDVYRGASTKSVDDENVLVALEDLILIHEPSGDLCLAQDFYEQARGEVARELGLDPITKPLSDQEALPFNNAVDVRLRKLDLTKPQILKEACGLETTSLSWADFKKRLVSLQARLENPRAEGLSPQTAKRLKQEIALTLDHPLPGKTLRTAVLEAMPAVITKFRSQLAMVQLKFSTAGVIASAFAANQQGLLPQVDFKRTQAVACRIRENLRTWFRIGAPALSREPLMTSLAEMLSRPNPNCPD
jgi:hypothetical protein